MLYDIAYIKQILKYSKFLNYPKIFSVYDYLSGNKFAFVLVLPNELVVVGAFVKVELGRVAVGGEDATLVGLDAEIEFWLKEKSG